MKKRITVITLVLTMLFSAIPVDAQLVEEEKQISIKKTAAGTMEYRYQVINDIELRGINGESKWFFNVDKDMKVKAFQLNLYVLINELIRSDISYFTVYMNDIPIKSMRIKNNKDDLLNSWTINIPTRLIKQGYNELKVKSYSRISDSPCEDDKNIANWVKIDGKTNYIITYDRIFTASDISDFPRPFVSLYADDSKGIGIVIPKDYSDKEISAALTLIAHMKASGISREAPSALITTDDSALSKYDSIIYVGDFDSVPRSLKGLLKKDAGLSQNAHIYRATLENNQKPVFMIVSDDGDRLLQAVKALNNDDIKAQMSGNYFELKPDIEAEIKEQKRDDYIYLTDLGMNGIEVKGSNLQVANLGLRIPANQMLAEEASINLRLRYSDNIDYEKSVISVYVNGIPIGSEKLERDKRDLHIAKFSLPESLRRSNYFDVRIVFELIPAGIIDCERYLASVPWAYIIEDSHYFFPTQERKLMLLNNLPFPFSKNDNLDSVAIVMPDKPSKDDLIIAGKIAELTGVGLKSNFGVISVTNGSEFSEKSYRNNNLIIFGTPQENTAIKSINDHLWFKFNKNFTEVLSNEKIQLVPETSATASFFELKKSPYDDQKGMMTITSMNKESIIKAIEYLKDSKRSLLTGDAAIITPNDDLLNFRFQKEEKDRPFINDSEKTPGSIRDYLIFTGVLLLFLIVSVAFYARKNRRQK